MRKIELLKLIKRNRELILLLTKDIAAVVEVLKVVAVGIKTERRGMKCNCPIYCRFCGARLKKDHIGHYCPTANCQ